VDLWVCNICYRYKRKNKINFVFGCGFWDIKLERKSLKRELMFEIQNKNMSIIYKWCVCFVKKKVLKIGSEVSAQTADRLKISVMFMVLSESLRY